MEYLQIKQHQLDIQMANIVSHNTNININKLGKPLKDRKLARFYYLLSYALQYPYWLEKCQIDNIVSQIDDNCTSCLQ